MLWSGVRPGGAVTRILGTTLLLGALVVPTAVAGTLPEVAVVGVHVPEVTFDEGVVLSEEIVQALELFGIVEGLTPAEVRSRLTGREDLVVQGMALRAGDDLLRSGRLLYERAQPDQAIPELQRATRALAHGALLTGETRDLIEAWLLLGLAEFGMNNQEAATAAWRQVAILAPERGLDPLNYPPRVIDRFDQVRQEVASLEQAALDVSASPGAPEVMVDGRLVGTAPVRVEGLAPGQHFVYAIDEFGHRAGRRVALEPGSGVSVQFGMEAYQLGIASSKPVGRARQTKELYEALGEHTQTALVLLAGLSGEGFVTLQLYSPRSGHFSKTLTADAQDDPLQAILDMVPAVSGYITSAGEIRTDRVALEAPALDVSSNAVLTRMLLERGTPLPVPPSSPPPSAASSGRGKVMWVAVGGAALAVGGAGAGLAFWALSQEDDPENPHDGTIFMSID